MAMTLAQKNILNAYADSQPALKPFAQINGKYTDDIKLGNMVSGDGLADSLRNKKFFWSGKMPAPAVAAALQDIPIYRVPCDGYITNFNLYFYNTTATWAAGTTTAQSYFTVPYLFYTTHNSYANSPCDLLTGMDNNTAVDFPLSQEVFLFVNGNSYSIAATGKNIVITAATAFNSLPGVGDILSIQTGASHFYGTNLVNVGVYRVTAVTNTTVSATKMNATNPMAISSVSANISDVGAVTFSPILPGMPVYANDVFGFKLIVPASGGTDISSVYLCANFTFQPNLGV